MKTSIVLDDAIFWAAKSKAEENRRSVSSVLNEWARVGMQNELPKPNPNRDPIRKLSVGLLLIDESRRSEWMSLLKDGEERP